jgi:histidinol-phosphate aminotransferase
VAGRVALEAQAATRRRVRTIVGRRRQWAEMFARAGLEPLPSQANFLLLRCGSAEVSGRVRDGLGERGILVREVGHYPGLEGCLRVSVGSGVALRETEAALREVLR